MTEAWDKLSEIYGSPDATQTPAQMAQPGARFQEQGPSIQDIYAKATSREPGWTYGEVLPIARGPEGQMRPAVPGMVYDAFSGMNRALKGELPQYEHDPETGEPRLSQDLIRSGGAAAALAATGSLGSPVPPAGSLQALAPIRAWHGTPHVWAPEPGAPFGRFQPSQVGTGEGNAAFGYAPGGYYAGTRGVSEGYRARMAPSDIFIDGKPLDVTNPQHYAVEMLHHAGNDFELAANRINSELRSRELAISLAQNQIKHLQYSMNYRAQFPSSIAAEPLSKDLRIIENLQGKIALDQAEVATMRQAQQQLLFPEKLPTPEMRPKGALYEVDIHADPAKLLFWDQTIAEQSPYAQSIIERLAQRDRKRFGEGSGLDYYLSDPHSYTGADIYKELTDAFGEANATRLLKTAGFPGSRHLNRENRNKLLEADLNDPGIYNYAMFDPKIIEVLRRYGLIPPAVVATGAALSDSGAQAAEREMK